MSRVDPVAFEKLYRMWCANPARFIETCIHDPDTRRPIKLLPAQRQFLKHAFQLLPNGRLKYPEQVFCCPKKSGKTTFAALHVVTTLFLFGGRYGEAFCVANDYDQAQGRVFEMCKRFVETSPVLYADARITDRRITLSTGGTIVPLASDFASAAGGHPTISTFDELWAYEHERARRMFDEMVPVPTRTISCRLTVSYAGFSGEGELLYDIYKRGLALSEIAPSLHAGDGLLMFWSHDPIAPWQTDEWLQEMRRSLRPNQYLRMIENRFVTTESTFVEPETWARCIHPNLLPASADTTLPVYIGIDASIKHDSTAIVAVTYDRNSQQVRLVAHRIFQPTPDEPINFEVTVERTILDLQKKFRVRTIWYDPYQMHAVAQKLLKAGAPIEEFPQTVPNLTAASQNLYELINAGNLAVYNDAAINLAIARAVAVESTRGWKITKEKATHKIDVVVALAQAALAAVRSQEESSWDWKYSGAAWAGLGGTPLPNEREDFQRARLWNHITGFH